jgi:hypothetical protein
MLKTNSRIEKEAVALYSQHAEMVEAVEQRKGYLKNLEATQKSMAHTAANTLAYQDDTDFDKRNVEYQINGIGAKLQENVATAANYVAENPKLQDIAAKDAQAHGIRLNLK